MLSEAQARSVFEPYFDHFSDCLLTGWDAWDAIRRTPEGRHLGKSARARIIWDEATARAEAVFEPMREVGKTRLHGLLVLDFPFASVRFKKLDRSLQTRGIPTQQQQLFAEQAQLTELGQQLSLWRPVPMVVAGYVLDRLETAINRLVLVLSYRGLVLWDIELPPAAERPANLMPVGQPPTPAIPRSTRPRTAEGQEAR